MDIVYLVVPLILLAVVFAAVWLERWSVPVILVALGLGIVFGSDVLNLYDFGNVQLANQVANAALVFILFQGGLATRRSDLWSVALPAGGLATWGVVLTAGTTFAVLHWVVGWPLERALLPAVVIASTDAAATFSILRRQSLPQRLSSTLEVESAANDPMAILMTLVVVEALATGESQGVWIVPIFLWKFIAGPAIGWVMAQGAVAVFNRLDPQDRGYYYVLLLAVVLLTYGLAELLHASGMLAVFSAGLVMGNEHFIYKQGIRNFSAALAMIANIGVFVMMGLLVYPSQWAGLWVDGLTLFVVLTFVGRPVAVWLGTLGMGLGVRDRLFASWAGLRGAVPIVLATFPIARGLPVGQEVFNLVFFAVLLSVSIQGSTLAMLANRLRLASPARPPPRYGLDLVTLARSELDLVVVDLPGPQGTPGPRVHDLVLPPRAVLLMIARGNEVVPPSGPTRLHGWDQVTVLAPAADEGRVRAALLEPFEHLEVDEDARAASGADDPRQAATEQVAALSDHVVLLGHGRVGAVLAAFLRDHRLPFVIVEQDRQTVQGLHASGHLALWGEADDPAVLDRAGVARARLMLVTVGQATVVRQAIAHAHARNDALDVVARVHQPAQRALLERTPRVRCVEGELEIARAMERVILSEFGRPPEDPATSEPV